jgi:hypothetical protein
MGRWFLGVTVIVAAACNSSPSSPSGDASLRVQVVDDGTGASITDSVYRLELQLTSAGRAYTQPVVNGIANFSSVVPAEYRLTSTSLFGYLQLDVLNVAVEGNKSTTLRLAPIDDFGVEQISVDGQGAVPLNGTIAIPLRGVTLRFRGRYQSPRSPWPAANGFGVAIRSAASDTYGHDGGRTTGGATSANEFEIAIPNWTPCSRFVDGRLSECFSSSDALLLTMSTPFDGRFGGAPLIRKSQKWPLKFELVPDCCLP